MKPLEQTVNFVQRLVIGFIITVFILIITGFIFAGVVGYKTYKAVDKDGVKGVVERVWNGNK